jgi:phosphopantothenoylcysteine decarboxylase / phosphopantothenate---cysteine ligase
VQTAAELDEVVRREFDGADVLLMAAAVADFRPGSPEPSKIEKAGRDGLSLELEPTADVLAALAAERRSDQTLVGFAAEHGERALERGREKLERKALDAVVVNDVSKPEIGFDAEDNEVAIVTRDEVRAVPRGPKADVAREIMDCVEVLRTRERQKA